MHICTRLLLQEKSTSLSWELTSEVSLCIPDKFDYWGNNQIPRSRNRAALCCGLKTEQLTGLTPFIFLGKKKGSLVLDIKKKGIMNVGSLPIKRVKSTYSEGACAFRGGRKRAGFSFISNMKKGKVKQVFTHSSLCCRTWNSHNGCNHHILCHNTLLRGDSRGHFMFLPHRDSEASPVSPIFTPLDASYLFSKN